MTAILGAAAAFYPTSGITVVITDRTVSKAGLASQTATYTIDNDKTVKNHAGTTLETWLTGGAVADYEVRATLSSGTAPSGTLGSWMNCATDRSWSVTNAAADDTTITSVILVEIRDAASPNTVRDNATITIQATSLSTA